MNTPDRIKFEMDSQKNDLNAMPNCIGTQMEFRILSDERLTENFH
jgi:hypothetical protein